MNSNNTQNLRAEFEFLLKKYLKEQYKDTYDVILAEYMYRTLGNFDELFKVAKDFYELKVKSK